MLLHPPSCQLLYPVGEERHQAGDRREIGSALPDGCGPALSFDDEGDLHVAPRLSSTSRVDASCIRSALRTL
jgi:hypothetical protein